MSFAKHILFAMCLLNITAAIRLQHRAVATRDKKDIFCMAFVGFGTSEKNFDLAETAMKKCDGYAFFSTTDDEAHNMYKIVEHAPKNKVDDVWEFPLFMWAKVKELGLTDQYKWFVNVETDAFIRPDKMKLTLQRFPDQRPVVVARQGRNSDLPIIGAVHVLSATMVEKILTVKDSLVNPKQYRRNDRLMSAWVKLAEGKIYNAINDQDGCTTFASTDHSELPSEDEIQALANGQSYIKNSPKKVKKGKPNLGDICYSSDLAVIHPVKDREMYAHLVESLSGPRAMNLMAKGAKGGLQIGVLWDTENRTQMHLTTGSLKKPAMTSEKWNGGARFLENLLTDLPAEKLQALEKCGPRVSLGKGESKNMKKKSNQVWLFASSEDPTSEELGRRFEKLPKNSKVLIMGSQWNDQVREMADSKRVKNVFVPFGSLAFAEMADHTPMELVDRSKVAAVMNTRDADHTVVYQQSKCIGYRQTFWDKICQGVNKVGKECSYLNKCNGDMKLGKKDQESSGARGDDQWMDAAVKNYARYNFAVTMEHKLNKYGYLTEKIIMAYLAGAIPVYGGASQATEIFDPDTFVEYHGEDGGDSAVEKIQELMADPKKHREMVLKQAVTDESMKKYFSWHASTFERYGDSLRMRIVNGLLSLCNEE